MNRAGAVVIWLLAGCSSGESSQDAHKGDVSAVDADCRSLPVGRTPLRRLTRAEYRNTVRDLIGVEVEVPLPADEQPYGFKQNLHLALNETQLGLLHNAARDASARAIGSMLEEAPCEIESPGCFRTVFGDLAKRAYRRPLVDLEMDELESFFELERQRTSAVEGAQLTVQLLLSSPYFLYHVEIGDESGALTAHELASRISYFLWQTMPDEELTAAADSGELLKDAELRRHGSRLIADEARLFATVAAFGGQWADSDSLLDAEKDTNQYPDWTPSNAATLVEELGPFVANSLLLPTDGVQQLLVSRMAYGDAELAALYGVAPTDTGTFELPPERAGVLARRGFLASHAHASQPSVVKRGRFVRERLLCHVIPPPPPDVNIGALDSAPLTRLEDPACSGCHQLMDPIGMTFDQFGAAGEVASGETKGEILNASPDLNGPVENLEHLASRLSTSESVASCLGTQWYRFATGRLETTSEGDSCSQAALSHYYVDTGTDLRAFLLEVVSSHAFKAMGRPDSQQ